MAAHFRRQRLLGYLRDWFGRGASGTRKPLVLRGARQVGKSSLIRDFCAEEGLELLELNFERSPQLSGLFSSGPNARTISALELHFGKRLHERSLLFLDEIQATPEVFARLRYFREEHPEISVVAAGSLLEFMLGDSAHGVPVGRLEYLHLGPARFEDFLGACGDTAWLELLRHAPPGELQSLNPVVHQQLLSRAREFSQVGGMPEAIARYTNRDGGDLLGCRAVQDSILQTTQEDFAKYRKRVPMERLLRIFQSLATQVGRKWMHARVNPDDRAQASEAALELLCLARVASRIRHSAGNGLPLEAEANDRYFKVLFLDVGLLQRLLGGPPAMSDWVRINEGAIAEQWVCQHLLDLREDFEKPALHYWVREKTGAQAEVDALLPWNGTVIPVEIKAGPSGRVRSLRVFLDEHPRSPFGVHFSTEPLLWDPRHRILRVPLYAAEQLPRLMATVG
jgi:predicted AAA+ superfamily ATPase